MAVSDPTANYGWLLPDVGGDIGAWGGILNSVFGEDGAGGAVKGIDQVIAELQLEVDALTVILDDLEDRVTTLEANPATALGARSELSSGQSVAKNSATKMSWGTSVFDEGDLSVPDITRMTVPTDGTGLWQIRGSIKAPRTVGSGDDGRSFLIQVRKNGTEILAEARIPYLNDSVDSSNSGDISLDVACLDVSTADGDYYEILLTQSFAAGGTGSVTVEAGNGSFMEAMRITKEIA